MGTKKKQEGIFGSIRMNKQKYLDEFKRLYDEGLTDSDIARKLEVSNTSISKWRKDMDLPKNFQYSRKFDTDKFMELYKQGLNYSKIAKILGVASSTIQDYAASLNLTSSYHTYENTVLTPEEFQVLIGTMYGDGYLGLEANALNVRGHFAHSLKQQNYCLWKYEKLQRFCKAPKLEQQFDSRTQKTYYSTRVLIHSHPIFTELYPKLYRNKIKYVNYELFNQIEPLGLAVLFMDDGCADHGSYAIATNCFTEQDIAIILKVFKEKFNLTFTMHKSHVIRLQSEDKEKFESLIKPYIHPDCLYKLQNSVPKTS